MCIRDRGDVVPEGAIELPEPEDVLAYGGVDVRLLASTAHSDSATDVATGTALPLTVRFESLPRGGRLELGFGDGPVQSMMLPELEASAAREELEPHRER